MGMFQPIVSLAPVSSLHFSFVTTVASWRKRRENLSSQQLCAPSVYLHGGLSTVFVPIVSELLAETCCA